MAAFGHRLDHLAVTQVLCEQNRVGGGAGHGGRRELVECVDAAVDLLTGDERAHGRVDENLGILRNAASASVVSAASVESLRSALR